MVTSPIVAGPNRNKYTMVAGKAFDFATMFNHAFADGGVSPTSQATRLRNEAR